MPPISRIAFKVTNNTPEESRLHGAGADYTSRNLLPEALESPTVINDVL